MKKVKIKFESGEDITVGKIGSYDKIKDRYKIGSVIPGVPEYGRITEVEIEPGIIRPKKSIAELRNEARMISNFYFYLSMRN